MHLYMATTPLRMIDAYLRLWRACHAQPWEDGLPASPGNGPWDSPQFAVVDKSLALMPK